VRCSREAMFKSNQSHSSSSHFLFHNSSRITQKQIVTHQFNTSSNSSLKVHRHLPSHKRFLQNRQTSVAIISIIISGSLNVTSLQLPPDLRPKRIANELLTLSCRWQCLQSSSLSPLLHSLLSFKVGPVASGHRDGR
jgi:hypothetical protein